MSRGALGLPGTVMEGLSQGSMGPLLVSSYRTSSLGPGPQRSHLAIRAVE